MATPDEWPGKFANLRFDRASGDPAPHKPLLLLVVLEMAEQGHLLNAGFARNPLGSENRHPTFQNDCYQHSFRKRMP